MRPFNRPWLLTTAMVLLAAWQPHAQGRTELRVVVAPGQRASTAAVALRAGEGWQMQVEAAPGTRQPNLSIFVHAAGGELVERDNPEAIVSTYTWRAENSGTFYLILQNTGDVPGTVVATPVAPVSTGSPGPLPSPRPDPAPRPATTPGRNYAVTRVFFATDRQPVSLPTGVFGTELSGQVHYGFSDISVPRDHRIGELEGPSIFRLEFRDNPEKHIVVLSVKAGNTGEFNRLLSDRLASSVRHEALLFVHGFNVTFEDALRRAAQISYDLAFDGPTIVFSWPSQGSMLPLDYRRDERNAELSADNLRTVIVDLFARQPNTTLHAIAHSMGNRVLSSALQQIAADTRVTARLQEVAMVAPDIDAELFRKAVGRVAGAAKRVTLYASSADAALKASQSFAGYPRAGQGGNNLVVVRGIDTVDASSVDTSILGLNHSYYADNTTFLSDLFHLLRGRPPAERFGLVSSKSSSGPYWLFRAAVR